MYACTLPASPTHYQIRSKLQQDFYLPQLGDDYYKLHQGKVRSWFNSLASLERVKNRCITGCFRTCDGERFCSGQCYSYSLFVSFPVVLVLEFKGSLVDKWDVPSKLHPLRPKDIKENNLTEKGLEYELVGRVLYKESTGHFCCRLRNLNRKGAYDYDDMKSEGFTRPISSSEKKSNHLSGQGKDIGLPEGFITHMAVYQLSGGAAAQQLILEHQLRAIRKEYEVECTAKSLEDLQTCTVKISSSSIIPLPSSERFWLKDPDRTDILGYVKGSVATATRPSRNTTSRTKNSSNLKLKIPARGKHSVAEGNEPSSSTALDDTSDTTEIVPVVALGRKRRRSSHITVISVDSTSSSSHLSTPEPDTSRTNQATKEPGESSPQNPPLQEPHAEEPEAIVVKCRCGVRGGREVDRLSKIKCSACNTWSHIGCQKDGRASDLSARALETYECDTCFLDMSDPLLRKAAKQYVNDDITEISCTKV